MKKIKILIAEDENDIRMLLRTELEEEEYEVIEASNGEEAWRLFGEIHPELGIFDVMMPKLDGISLLQKIRRESDMPIILLTARDTEVDKVSGLSLGADDYIVKPFSIVELKARINVQIRKLQKSWEQKENEQILKCGNILLDKKTGTVFSDSKVVSLNAKEYQLLLYFMEHQGMLLTKKQIYDAVWEEEYVFDDNTIMVHISRLRNKLEKNPQKPDYLTTFRGIGYKMDVPR
jgi:DNA-binding response OmpR family regulator